MSAISKVEAFLLEKGYIRPEKPGCGDYTHRCGLPPGIRVACKWSNVDGKRACMVTPTEVIVATLLIPYNHNNWRIVKRRTYNTPQELQNILDEEVPEPQGCW
jgi:hypothetical protein